MDHQREFRGRQRALTGAWLMLLASACLAAPVHAQTVVKIEPSRLVDATAPLHVRVAPLADDATVDFQVVLPCTDHPGTPCPTVVPAIDELRDAGGLSATFDFRDSPLPANLGLRLRTLIQQGAVRQRIDRVFAVSADACGLLKAILDIFTGAPCADGFADGLANMHFGATAAASTAGFVLVHEGRRDVVLHSTAGATGIAWLDDNKLVFTSLGPPLTSREIAAGITTPKPGLYEVGADGRSRRLLVDTEGVVPEAPFVHPDGRITMLVPGKDGAPMQIWTRQGEQVVRTALDAPIDSPAEAVAAVATDATQRLLVSGQLDGDVLASIDLGTGHVDMVPLDRRFATLLRRPLAQGGWPIATLGLDSGATSTYIARIDADGKLLETLVKRYDNTFMPVVSPDRRRFACLVD